MNPYVSFISNSSLFISTMSVSLSLYYTVITASTINYSRLIVVFFGTLTSYIGVQLIPISKNKIINQRTEWIKKHKLILISLMVISFIVITLSIKNLNSFDILNFIHLFILVLFYEKIFINKYELRKLPYFKPVIIAYIWACTCTAPALYSNLNSINYWIWVECFLFILALAIPFDIRDIETDSLESIKTIPIKFGINNSRFICLVLFVCSLILQYQYIEFTFTSVMISLTLTVIYIFLLKKSWPDQNDNYFLYGFDGLMAFKLFYLLAF